MVNLDNVSVQEADAQIKSETWEIYWELSLFIKEKEFEREPVQCSSDTYDRYKREGWKIEGGRVMRNPRHRRGNSCAKVAHWRSQWAGVLGPVNPAVLGHQLGASRESEAWMEVQQWPRRSGSWALSTSFSWKEI